MTTTAAYIPPSRLPEVGTTIFTTMSTLAASHQAVNLGQGFPDFACDPALIDAVSKAMHDGQNQYAPMTGAPVLREAIAHKIADLYGHRYDASSEITVTAGATQAILTAVLATVSPGDEVIVIEPSYDSYVPSIRLAGGIPVFVSMMREEQGFAIPWELVMASITPKTRMIILNSPHNPTGFVLDQRDIAALTDIVINTDILIVSDEVYEHMVYDGVLHESLSRYPALAERSIVISSFGKTFHVTGWKIAYAAAPAALMEEFRKVHQYNAFSVNTPMQIGLANFMLEPAHYLELPVFYQNKRDYFRQGLEQSRFRVLPVQGTYFQCVDYSAISDLPDMEFAQWLTREAGVAAIPLSAFYSAPQESGIVRFCFAKKEATLALALERLARV